MTEHDEHGGPDEAWTGAQHRLDRLRHDVASGVPARPSGGARSARRRGARRRTTRLLGVATAVAAVAVAVPVGLAITGGSPVDRGLQVATQDATPVPTPARETAPAPVQTITSSPAGTGEPDAAAPATATLSAGSGVGSPSGAAPTGAAEVDGPPAEDVGALAAATVVDLASLEGGSQTELGVVGFASPSGNIICGVGSPGTAAYEVQCRVAEASWASRPTGDACGGAERADWQPTSLGLFQGRSGLGRCGNDTVLTPDPPTLGYGTAVVLGDVRCTSLESGLTCQDTATGAGFRASRTSALVW